MKKGHFSKCPLVCAKIVKLRSKSSDFSLKNIFGNKASVKLSEFQKSEFIENIWTSTCLEL